MKRLQDWPTRLALALTEAESSQAQFGELDCCLFAANMVRAMTGIDPAPDLRGKYSTESGARKLMDRRFGGLEKTVEAIALRSGLEEINPNFAQRGDVVLLDVMGEIGVGIVDLNGHQSVVFSDRLARVPLRRALRAWRV